MRSYFTAARSYYSNQLNLHLHFHFHLSIIQIDSPYSFPGDGYFATGGAPYTGVGNRICCCVCTGGGGPYVSNGASRRSSCFCSVFVLITALVIGKTNAQNITIDRNTCNEWEKIVIFESIEPIEAHTKKAQHNGNYWLNDCHKIVNVLRQITENVSPKFRFRLKWFIWISFVCAYYFIRFSLCDQLINVWFVSISFSSSFRTWPWVISESFFGYVENLQVRNIASQIHTGQ